MHTKSQQASILEKRIERPRLHLRYPKIRGLSNPYAEEKINQAIQSLLFSMIKDQGYANPQTEITATYKTRANKNGVLSITFDVYAYSTGAAHGLTVMKSTTFNLETGKLYSFNELFKRDGNYQNVINTKIKMEIKEKGIPLLTPFQSIAKNQEYYLTDDSLVIYFQAYQYTPYAFGIPEFPIHYSSIKNIINPYGPIPRISTH